MRFTEEQQKIIDFRGGNMLVSAAAGSGKTAVLVARVLSLLTDPQDPLSLDQLVIMSFTEAAADNMRQKIAAALRERIAQDPGNRRLKLQQRLLPRARISTIHGICLGLIRQYYSRLGIDPMFRVGDEGELKMMRNDVVTELLEEYYGEASPAFVDFSTAFAGRKTDDRLSELILKTYDFISSEAWPEDYLEEQRRICRLEEEGELRELPWYRELTGEIRGRLQECLRFLERAAELSRMPGGPAMYLPAVESYMEDAGALLEALDGDYEALYGCLAAHAGPGLKPARGKDLNKELKDEAKALFDRAREYIDKDLKEKLLTLPPSLFKACIRRSGRDMEILARLTAEFMERFRARKREKNIADFSDLEHFALQLLYEKDGNGARRPSEAADELARNLRAIMIDEYQDSNLVQEEIIRALSAERFGRPDVFMVGDVKQSIYSFREARPQLFMEKYEEYGKERGGSLFELSRNFRSCPEVLDSVNQVFAEVMKKPLGGIEYDERAMLRYGQAEEDGGAGAETESAAETEFLLLEKAASDAEETEAGINGAGSIPAGSSGGTDDEDAGGAAELEYKLIAQKIRELTGMDGNPPYLIKDKDTSEKRPAEFRDIAVLMRDPASKAEKLVRILGDSGIPAYFPNSTGYFDVPEVRLMLSFLQIIDNPRQDIPLTAVMHSSIGGMTDDEISRMRAAYKRDCAAKGLMPEGMYQALCFCSRQEGPLSEKAARFLDLLNAFRSCADYLPVQDVIARIYDETGYDDCVSAMPMGRVRRKNLDMLMEMAESYARTSYSSLPDFVRYIETIRKFDADYGEAVAYSGNENIVRVTSIHRSKGLEYPIVILACLSKTFNMAETRAELLRDHSLGMAGNVIDAPRRLRFKNPKKEIILQKKLRENRGEELRVLYVAMTRAEQKLIMTARFKNVLGAMEAKGKLRDPVLASSFADWILMSRPASVKKEIMDVSCIRERQQDAQQQEKLRHDTFLTIDPSEVFDPALRDRLMQEQEASYVHPDAVRLRPKISVSEIKHRFMEQAEEEPPLQLLPAGTVSEGALRGTAFHRAMELLDFTDPDPAHAMETLLADTRLSAEDRKHLSRSDAEAFLRTELARRMGEALGRGRLFREEHFMLRIEAERYNACAGGDTQLLQGIIDAYFEEGDGLVLLDYKTDRVTDADELVRRYAVQLELYREALERIRGMRVSEVWIYSSCLKQSILLGNAAGLENRPQIC